MLMQNPYINSGIYLVASYIVIWMVERLLFLFDKYVFKKMEFYQNTYDLIKKRCKDPSKLDLMIEEDDQKRRWYLVHAIANTVIVWTVFPDFLNILLDPFSAITTEFNTLPLAIAISLHLFHIITSRKFMDMVDWLHHLISCLFVGLVSLVFLKSPLINYKMFFLCGLPGGIDYYLLALGKYGVVDRMTEKRINLYLNMWIRMPGILYGCFTAYICYLYQQHNYNILVYILVVFLNMYNSIYFAGKVTMNYGARLMLDDIQQKNKEKINVPKEDDDNIPEISPTKED